MKPEQLKRLAAQAKKNSPNDNAKGIAISNNQLAKLAKATLEQIESAQSAGISISDYYHQQTAKYDSQLQGVTSPTPQAKERINNRGRYETGRE